VRSACAASRGVRGYVGIAQIDVPGEGLIHVLPDNMRALHDRVAGLPGAG